MSWFDNQARQTIKPNAEGQYEVTGLKGWALKPFVDEEGLADQLQKKDVNKLIINNQVDPSDVNLGKGSTLDEAQAEINRVKKKEVKDKGDLNHERGLEPTKLLFENQEKTMKAGFDQQDKRHGEQMTMFRERYLNEARESRLDRAERADQRADDRLMQMEMFDRQDRRSEKNRRRESIQALVAGLSSLGAAFAI